MKRLRATSVVFSGLVFAVLSLTLVFASAPAHADASLSNWHKGILVQSTYNTDFSSSNFQQSMRNAAADGVNYVTLVVLDVQSNIYSTDIHAGGTTPTDQALASGINYVHSLGMQAAVSFHDDPTDSNWRAYINPGDRTTWFANYSAALNHYADIAQSNGAQELVIGTEMSDMTNPSSNSSNTANWQAMIQSARGHFHGLMSYDAQHGGYMSDDTTLGFWSSLDEIGISAYYSMGSNNASVADMQSTWSQIDNNELRGLAKTYGKPIDFLEVGYISGSNGLSDPGTGYSNPGSYSPQNQANAYQALLSYWSNSSYMDGVSFWDWSTNPNAGGNNDLTYTPQNKPAEQVLKQWYTGGGTPAGSQPGQPTQPTAPAQPSTYGITASGSNATTTTTGNSVTSTVNVSSSQNVSNSLVDVEVYDANGKQVAQKYYQNQSLFSGGSPYQISWTPTVAGQYKVEAGIFTANWQSNLLWNGSVITVTASSPSQPSPTPPVTPAPPTSQPITPTPTPTPTPVPTPTPPVVAPTPTPTPAPTAPTVGSNVDIWWPGNGVSVSGVQPFKALIDGVDQSTYKMYWQVDGGQLNAMNVNTSGGTHQEADVDLSGWNWHGNGGQYVINFVAKDNSGNVISQKSVTITITH